MAPETPPPDDAEHDAEPEVYVPAAGDVDTHAEAIMHQGKYESGADNNDLRDPWFHTLAGQAFLEQHGEL